MKRIIFILAAILLPLDLYAYDIAGFRQKETRFIRELYESGRYFDCIAETGKLQVYGNTPSLEYFVYANYFFAGQYSTVINNYTPAMPGDELRFRSLLLVSGSFLKKGMYYESYKILKEDEYSTLPGKYHFTMFLRRVEPLILAGDMEMIDNEIKLSETLHEDPYNFTELRRELQLYGKEGLKSPGCSAVMSAVIPGLGQIYSGYPLEGVMSFLSVAATAAAGLYMKDRGKDEISYTLFFFSGLFYGGNIYGAYNSARSSNAASAQRMRSRIVSQYGSYNPGDYMDMDRLFN